MRFSDFVRFNGAVFRLETVLTSLIAFIPDASALTDYQGDRKS
jgi:hypothetical protein